MVLLGLLSVLVLLMTLGAVACLRLPRKTAFVLAGSLWLLYALYEYLMYRRVLCSGDCNIRVDLLLIYPVLLVVTLAAAWRLFRSRQRSSV